ncbi:MAG TPA: TlpA disulfide reductase family protein [Saprospiraceae bacterium]|nr:TlpA disulfide reductase family protein [Saprospiraceae bacterium]
MLKIFFTTLTNQIPHKYFFTLFFVFHILGASHAQHQYDALIRKAAINTYVKGSMSYKIEYSHLSSAGDTMSDIYNVTVIKNKKEFSFNSRFRDSLFQVYYENILLRGWEKSKRFEVSNLGSEDVIDDVEYIFKPFFNKKFLDLILEDAINTSMLVEDPEKIILKINYPNQEEISEIYQIINISKKNSMISEYGLHVSIAGVPVWQNEKILSSNKLDTKDNLLVNKNLFFNTLGNYKPYCNCPTVKNPVPQKENAIVDIKVKLPSLRLINTQQDTMQLNQLHAKYYLVDFWYRACHPCIKALPMLAELHKKYDTSQLQIVSINNVDKNELVDKFRLDNQIEYPVYVKSVELDQAFEGIHAYPTFIIYDSNFKVLKVIEGFSADLLQKIEEVIK